MISSLTIEDDLHIGHYEIPEISHSHSHKRSDETVSFEIKAFGETFSFELFQDSKFASDAKILSYDGNAQLVSEIDAPQNLHYSSEDKSAQFTFFEQGYIKGTFMHEGEMIYVDPMPEHQTRVGEEMKRSTSLNVVFKHSDLVTAPNGAEQALIDQIMKRAESLEAEDPMPFGAGSVRTNDQGYLFGSGECTVARVVQLEVVIDASFYHRAMKSAFPTEVITEALTTTYCNAIVGTIARIYERQIGIHISITNIRFFTVYSSTPAWQNPNPLRLDEQYEACTVITQAQLNSNTDTYLRPAIVDWVASLNLPNDRQFHVFTDCMAIRFCGRPSGSPCGGTIGQAWLGICKNPAWSPGYNSGWNSWHRSPTFMLTVAHELGHNFNANHAFQKPNGENLFGIMSYAGTKAHEFSLVAQTQMCQHMRDATCMPLFTECSPNCGSKECGPSDCDNTLCGTCDTGSTCNSAGRCIETCVPSCTNKNCGSNDGCGNVCTTGCICVPEQTCSALDAECGIDSCGVSCGSCPSGEYCNGATRKCLANSQPWLAAHNAIRATEGVSSLTWSTTLSESAQTVAEGCGDVASTADGINTMNRISAGDPGTIVNLWAAEGASWSCNRDTGAQTCTSGSCGNFLQLIWDAATEVGCSCESSCTIGGQTQQYCVCLYDQGAAMGELPYAQSQCEDRNVCDCAGKACNASDGCGGFCRGTEMSCGTGLRCGNDGVCRCVPTAVCGTRNCGTINDGCGNVISCGTCTGPEECHADGRCGLPEITCTPLTCGARECGNFMDGCGGVMECGSCLDGETCDIAGSSSECIPRPCEDTTCGSDSTTQCVAGECQCRPGYIGSPETQCTLPEYPRGWKKFTCPTCVGTVTEKNVWRVVNDGNRVRCNAKAADREQALIEWTGSSTISDFSKVSFGADIRRIENSADNCAGLALGLSESTFVAFCIDQTYGLIAREHDQNYGSFRRSWWTLNPQIKREVGTWFSMEIELLYWGTTKVIQVYVDGEFAAGTYAVEGLWPQIGGNKAGLYSTGGALFDTVVIKTAESITLTVANCDNTNLLRNDVARILDIPLSNVEITDCSKKRQAETAVVTATVIGAYGSTASTVAAAAPTSTVLAGTLVSTVGTVSSATIGTSVAITSAVVAAAAAVPAGVTIATTLTAGTAIFGMSVATAAVVGGAAVVVVVGGVAGAAVALSGDSDDEEIVSAPRNPVPDVSPEPVAQPVSKPERGKVDIFGMDASAPQSLTQRQPGIMH